MSGGSPEALPGLLERLSRFPKLQESHGGSLVWVTDRCYTSFPSFAINIAGKGSRQAAILNMTSSGSQGRSLSSAVIVEVM